MAQCSFIVTSSCFYQLDRVMYLYYASDTPQLCQLFHLVKQQLSPTSGSLSHVDELSVSSYLSCARSFLLSMYCQSVAHAKYIYSLFTLYSYQTEEGILIPLFSGAWNCRPCQKCNHWSWMKGDFELYYLKGIWCWLF